MCEGIVAKQTIQARLVHAEVGKSANCQVLTVEAEDRTDRLIDTRQSDRWRIKETDSMNKPFSHKDEPNRLTALP